VPFLALKTSSTPLNPVQRLKIIMGVAKGKKWLYDYFFPPFSRVLDLETKRNNVKDKFFLKICEAILYHVCFYLQGLRICTSRRTANL
jgi:hypothetical protein